MREPFTQLYLHLMWATWNRAPLLTPVLRDAVHRCVNAVCAKLNVELVAFGGVADHVHILTRIPTTVSDAVFVKQVKGSSSHLLGQRLRVAFKWQGAYRAFSISPSQVPRVRNYVLNQEQHHADGTLLGPLELPPDDPPQMIRAPDPDRSPDLNRAR